MKDGRAAAHRPHRRQDTGAVHVRRRRSTPPAPSPSSASATPTPPPTAARRPRSRSLDHLARHPATARAHRPQAVRPLRRRRRHRAALVGRLAQVYLDNGTAIAPVLRALFTSPEFAASIGAKVRTPVRGPGRARSGRSGLQPGDDRRRRRSTRPRTTTWSTPGNAPMRWAPPNGYPDVAAAWTVAVRVPVRWNAHLNLAAGWYPKQLTRPASMLASLVPGAAGHARRPGRRARAAGWSAPPCRPAHSAAAAQLPRQDADESAEGDRHRRSPAGCRTSSRSSSTRPTSWLGDAMTAGERAATPTTPGCPAGACWAGPRPSAPAPPSPAWSATGSSTRLAFAGARVHRRHARRAVAARRLRRAVRRRADRRPRLLRAPGPTIARAEGAGHRRATARSACTRRSRRCCPLWQAGTLGRRARRRPAATRPARTSRHGGDGARRARHRPCAPAGSTGCSASPAPPRPLAGVAMGAADAAPGCSPAPSPDVSMASIDDFTLAGNDATARRWRRPCARLYAGAPAVLADPARRRRRRPLGTRRGRSAAYTPARRHLPGDRRSATRCATSPG